MDWLRIDITPVLHQELTLSDEALRHAAALRLRPGEAVGLLNGRGDVAHAVVARVGRGVCRLRVTEHRHNPPPADITIAIGLLDSRERMEYAVEKCTELGVRRIVLLECRRSQRQNVRMERLQQKAEAAMLQSGRAWMPELTGPISVEACLHAFPEATVVVGDQHGVPPASCPTPILLMVGPEGGFAPDEQENIATRKPMIWRIGSHRLRTETAAVVLTAAALTA